MTASQPVAERRVGAHQDKAAEAKGQKDKIEHDAPPLRDGGEMMRPS